MSDAYRRVTPGEKLRVPARAWNRLMDEIAVAPGATGDGVGQWAAPYTVVYAKNSAGQDVPRWGAMAITGLESVPAGVDAPSTRQFEEMPILSGGVPTTSTTAWCIAVDPIKAGQIGRVAVDGVVQCKVAVSDSTHGFVRTRASVAELESATSGDAVILYKQSGTGSGKWALIRFSSRGGGAVVRGVFSSNWLKGETATVIDAFNSNQTYTARNYFASLTTSTAKACAIALVGGEWILIAAEC